MSVTSIVLPIPKIETNVILNPHHSSFSDVKIVDSGKFEFDDRFLQLLPQA